MPPTDDDTPRILVLDGNERNAALLGKFLEKEGYEPAVITNLDTAGEVREDVSQFSFASVDLDWFDSPIWSYCERLHEQRVPFIVLSGLRTPALVEQSYQYGTDSFVVKPIAKREFRELIRTVIES